MHAHNKIIVIPHNNVRPLFRVVAPYLFIYWHNKAQSEILYYCNVLMDSIFERGRNKDKRMRYFQGLYIYVVFALIDRKEVTISWYIDIIIIVKMLGTHTCEWLVA